MTQPAADLDGRTTARSLAVIGGGITGLAAAHRAVELAPGIRIRLFEASERLGGVLRTEHRDGFLIEHSADSFLSTMPRAMQLCERVGLADQMISTELTARRAMVVCRGRLEPVPDGFQLMAARNWRGVLSSKILSPWGKLRVGLERWLPPGRTTEDESLAHFIRRRVGSEAYRRLVQPLVGGIYTSDPEQLSARAALPRFVEMEQRYGSLGRALAAEPASASASDGGARYSQFVAPRGGMQSMVQAVASRLPSDCIELGCRVERSLPVTPSAEQSPSPAEGKWQVQYVDRTGRAVQQAFDAVCVAAPAPAAGRLLAAADSSLAALLESIAYAGCTIVVLAYPRASIGHPLAGSGFVVPQIEHLTILAGSFASIKFAGRAPADRVLLRIFWGGPGQTAADELSDAELVQSSERELKRLLSISGTAELTQVIRWRSSMPQYLVGHPSKVAEIAGRVAQLPGLALAGNAYQGVGVPQCVASGERAAERLLGPAPEHATGC